MKAIKQHALNFEETRYDMAIVHDAFKTMFSTVQKEGESLQDYTKRFRVAKEVLESHIGGPLILSKIVKSMPNYKDSDVRRTLCEKSAYERYMAYVYLKNADQGKYGSILSGLSTQKSLGNDQYPKTISDATSVLNNHPFDNHKKQMHQNHPKQKAKLVMKRSSYRLHKQQRYAIVVENLITSRTYVARKTKFQKKSGQ